MILIIAEPSDLAAHWLHRQLQRAMAVDVGMVTPTQLLCSRSIEHRMDDAGSSSRFVLASGEAIDSGQLTGIINRLTVPPTAHFAQASSAEQSYATQELHAFLVGWLASAQCPVINRPSPAALSGPWHSPIETAHFAALCGLDVAESMLSATRSLFVLSGRLIGPLIAGHQRDRLLQFASLWGGELLQLDVVHEAQAVRLVRAETFADYRLGGDLLVRAIARELTP